jgi:hypothetical protein
VLTLCDELEQLEDDAVSRPAKALGEVLRSRIVRWHHAERPRHKGTSLYYKPVRPRDIERSYLQAEDTDMAAADAAHYKTLALCEATGWDRVALNPLEVQGA